MLPILNLYEQPVNVTIHLLRRLNVKVTNETVSEAVLNHPDYPSILSISDTLAKLHIENAAITIDGDRLDEVSLPFIAFVRTAGSFVLVTDIKNSSVFYISDTSKVVSKPISDFLKEFAGVVLLAEASEISGDLNFEAKKKNETLQLVKIYMLIAVAGLIVISTIINNAALYPQFTVPYSFLLLLKVCGIVSTVLLLWYEVDKANPALQKICSGGKKTNCNAILNSTAAKIAGLSWSELGFFYFSGGFLFLLMRPNSVVQQLSIIAILNLIALPYIFFSVFYQWRIAKQWCPLCLTVQAILFTEFLVNMFFQNLRFGNSIDLVTLFRLFISFSLPVAVWLIIKPLLLNKQKAKQDFRSLQRIKFNNEIFLALLQKQKRMSEPTDGLGILLGNKSAQNTLIKVCNPYCGPCAKAHPEIEKLLEETDNLKVQIIFTATNSEHDFTALPVKHLLDIAQTYDESLTKKALDDWYLAEKKDYKVFTQKYRINGELKDQNSKVDAMSRWCKKVDIQFTPTIFFNGYQLPNAYSISDLGYFLKNS
ncbi:MAG: vitamin K epoxide reductase family protein [Ginsengibacter sp.]